jgi:hypothetical protein
MQPRDRCCTIALGRNRKEPRFEYPLQAWRARPHPRRPQGDRERARVAEHRSEKTETKEYNSRVGRVPMPLRCRVAVRLYD